MVNKMFIIMAFCLGELETSAGQVSDLTDRPHNKKYVIGLR